MKETKLNSTINLFEGSKIRSIWDSEKEDYYFSVVDVIAALTDLGKIATRKLTKKYKPHVLEENNKIENK